MNNRGIQDIQTLVRNYLQSVLREGDIAVDATAGRGRDTLFLAECVGAGGKVFAFDIQEEAILATRRLLEGQGLLSRVELLKASHTEMAKYVSRGVKVILFNLGYLPGGPRYVTTQAQTTLRAAEVSLDLLQETGLAVFTIYRGHEGGPEESRALTGFLSGIPKKEFSVFQGIYLNQGDLSPYWIMVQKNRKKVQEEDS